MTRDERIRKVLASGPADPGKGFVLTMVLMIALGAAGLGLGFFAGAANAGWTSILTGLVLAAGIGASGVLISAIFTLTNARFGRAYVRLAESCAGFMPVALVLAIVFVALGGTSLPWAHDAGHLTGGKAVWLRRGFWDLRVIGALLLSFSVSIAYLYYSIRRDWAAIPGKLRETYSGIARAFAGRNLDGKDQETERMRCAGRLDVLAPIVAMVYAITFTMLGFDLIMALDPLWYSTLFGAWYFIGNLFATMALLAIVSIVLHRPLGLGAWITPSHRSDLATLLFAFCLVNADFFWSQYLTIWYGNLPEETGYVMKRTLDGDLPWRVVSWLSLVAFLAFPFILLLFRRVKRSGFLLSIVSIVCISGIFMARYIEIAPELLGIAAPARLDALYVPFASALLTFIGVLGVGLLVSMRVLRGMPVMPVGDDIFHAVHADEGDHS